jgi:hypothetical protein
LTPNGAGPDVGVDDDLDSVVGDAVWGLTTSNVSEETRNSDLTLSHIRHALITTRRMPGEADRRLTFIDPVSVSMLYGAVIPSNTKRTPSND